MKNFPLLVRKCPWSGTCPHINFAHHISPACQQFSLKTTNILIFINYKIANAPRPAGRIVVVTIVELLFEISISDYDVGNSEVTNELLTHLWNIQAQIHWFPGTVFPTSFHGIHNIIFTINSHQIVHWYRIICTYVSE